ncbi:MAG: BTAD domain-containing putative transcriptional regulator, partial [Longimicrobiales bacterium]
MFRLETFGGLVLADGAGSSVAAQRRRLALLALLATAADRGISRDRLVAFLWPENGADSARHSLEQLLYLLRRQFDEALFTGTDPLCLNSQVITSDVGTFEQALTRGEDAEAVALYRGPFLDGFYLGDEGEFERWAEGERSRLAEAYATALGRLAAQAAKRGDRDGAVAFWRKLVAVDTLSSRNVLGLLRSLAAAGDRPEALRLAESYETLIREELDISLEPELQAFVDELRASRVAVESAATSSSRSIPASDTDAKIAVFVPPLPVEAKDALATIDPPRLRRSALRPSVLIAGIVALAIGATWGARETMKSARAQALDPDRILVPPFRIVNGDSSLAHLRDLLPVLLSAQLTGEGGPAAIDSRTALSALQQAATANRGELTEDDLVEIAREQGAGQVLLGEAVVTAPGQLELSGRIVPNTSGRSGNVRASVAGPADSMPSLVKSLAGQLLVLHAGEHPQRISSLTTRSPEALRAFLEGRAEHRRGRDAGARELFAAALDHDSTFALAALELAIATARVFRWSTITTDTIRMRGISLTGEAPNARSDEDLWNRAMELAWRGRDQFNAADRALLLALRVPEAGLADETLAGWEQAIRAAPDRAEAHYWYGYVLLHQGFAMGVADSRTRAASSFRHAVDLDSAYLNPLTGLVEIAAYERDTRALRHWRAKYFARDSIGGQADYVRWLVAAAIQDERALRGIRARFASLDIGTLARIQRMSQMSGIALEDAERADSAILGRTHESQERQIALHHAIFLVLNRGQPKQAARLMDLKRELDPGPDLGEGFALRYALMWDGDSADAASAMHAMTERFNQT